MRALMQPLFVLRRLLFRALNLRTSGVKVMLFNPAGELLLVRNNYGRRDLFLLPGGGIKRNETPEAAAAREAWEETGTAARQLTLVSEHFSKAEGRRDTIYLFSGVTDGTPKPDGIEVAEARFFPLDQLPANVSSAALRRIAEHLGDRQPDGSW